MPSDTQEKEKKAKAQVGPVVRAYTRAMRKYPWLGVGILLGAVTIEVASLIAPLIGKRFIDTLSTHAPSAAIVSSLISILILFAITGLVGWVGQRVRMLSIMYMESRVMADLSNHAFQYLIRHSNDFFASNFAGTLTRRVNRYARSFEQVLDTAMFSFFSTGVFALGAVIVLFGRSALLGILLFIGTAAFLALQIFMARRTHPLRVASAAQDSVVTGVLSDAISNQSAISLFAAAPHEFRLFGNAIETWRSRMMRYWLADSWAYAIQGLLAVAMEVGLLGGGLYLWQKGLITVGDFVLIQVYILGLLDRIWNLGNSMRRVYTAFADAYEMVAILETPHGVEDVPNASELTVTKGAITFANVSFGFAQERSILAGLNLAIRPGERAALVGPSGAGKSTITKLLLRMYDVTEGEIAIDGQNIAKVTQDSLRTAISFVPQEPILFHRSLMDNIRYGRLDATDEEVMEAAKQARCHEFISGLPLGYGTHVGERGIKLSGGERQRVAIARAILKNAPILILDEATSSLDSESESLIQEALDTLMKGKTVLVIAHRLSTIMRMDRIIVLEKGAIVAEGTHQELLDHRGLYHKLWSIQAGSFVADA